MLARTTMRLMAAAGDAFRRGGSVCLQKKSMLFPHLRQLSDFATRPLVFDVSSSEDFEEHVLNSDIPVVVDFHANWCGPCKMLGPRLEQKILGRDGQVLMARVDIDEAAELAMEYQVSAVPTVLSIHRGEVISSFQGMIGDEEIDQFLDETIEGAHEE